MGIPLEAAATSVDSCGKSARLPRLVINSTRTYCREHYVLDANRDVILGSSPGLPLKTAGGGEKTRSTRMRPVLVVSWTWRARPDGRVDISVFRIETFPFTLWKQTSFALNSAAWSLLFLAPAETF